MGGYTSFCNMFAYNFLVSVNCHQHTNCPGIETERKVNFHEPKEHQPKKGHIVSVRLILH